MESIILETNLLWGSSFFPKYSKFYVDFGNTENNSENIFRFLNNCIWIGCVKHSLLLRENTSHRLSICWQNVSRFKLLLRQNFSSSFFSYWWKNTKKILRCWFKQCFGPLNMLTAHKCSDTGLFRHLSNPAFSSP